MKEPDSLPGPVLPARRTVLKAAAWSVPAIALAGSAPAAAASPQVQLELVSGPYEGIEVEEQVPIVFAVTGAPDGTAASATVISGTSVVSLDTPIVQVEDGQLILLVTVLAHGAFQFSITIGELTVTPPNIEISA